MNFADGELVTKQLQATSVATGQGEVKAEPAASPVELSSDQTANETGGAEKANVYGTTSTHHFRR